MSLPRQWRSASRAKKACSSDRRQARTCTRHATLPHGWAAVLSSPFSATLARGICSDLSSGHDPSGRDVHRSIPIKVRSEVRLEGALNEDFHHGAERDRKQHAEKSEERSRRHHRQKNL